MRKVWSTWTSWECATSRVPPCLPIGSLKELNSARFNSHTPACKPRREWTCGVFSGEIPNFCKGKTWKKNLYTSFIHHWITVVDLYTSWWLNQPICKILVKLNYFSKFRDENQKIFELPPPSIVSFPEPGPWTFVEKKRSLSWGSSPHTREEVYCWEILKKVKQGLKFKTTKCSNKNSV